MKLLYNFGALYAVVLGIKKTFKKLTKYDKRIIIFTVGLIDPTDNENIDNIKSGIKKNNYP